jgi:septum formation protein
MPIVLASASPRRADLLRAAGFSFVVDPVDIDESLLPGETPETHVRRLARGKAQAGARRHPDRTVLGADTVVVVDGRILGKPRDDADAAAMLGALSGRVHHVYSAVAVVSDGVVQDGLDVSAVTFAPLPREAIAEYVASGEPRDKAGAYAIQGWAARYIERLEGSYSGVVGLPVAVVHRLLISLGPDA